MRPGSPPFRCSAAVPLLLFTLLLAALNAPALAASPGQRSAPVLARAPAAHPARVAAADATPSTATDVDTDAELLLPNGLRVVVHPDHRAPTAVVQVWYRVGSIDETDGTSGLAHVLEHMMFKGTPQVPAGQFSRIVARVGGRDNAFTGQDHTAYFEQIHRDQLSLALRMEADRMVNLRFRDSDFASEIKVVMEERHLRTDDQPKALVYEQLMANALLSNPYRRPIIGWPDDLAHLTANDARTWYRTWYAPNNAILVVAGDVTPAQVFALARHWFGALKPRALPVRRPQAEQEQLGARRITVRAQAAQPFLLMAWPAPALRNIEQDWEPYALELLAGVLAAGDISRFSLALVRGSQVAVAADAGYEDLRRGPGMFSVEGTPAEGHTVAELEQALLDQIRRVQENGVSDDELRRVKAQVISEQVYGRDSTFLQAMQIGTFDALGLPWRATSRVTGKLQQVTAAQVQQVAQRYLVPAHQNLAVLDPQPLPVAPATPTALPGDAHAH